MIHVRRVWLCGALRTLALVGIVLGGLVTLVGSGGGVAIGFPPCDADWCNNTPSPPAMSLAVQPPYVTALVGSTVTFTAQVSDAAAPLKFQWSSSSDGATFNDIPGATTASLNVPMVNLGQDGSVYRVRATAGDGITRLASSRLAVAPSPGVVIQDGDLTPGNWQASARANPPGTFAPHSETGEAVGGNPGRWLKMIYQIPSGAGVATISYLRNGAVYDPRLSGAIYVIDYAEDCLTLQLSDTQWVESQLVFEQAGRRYSTAHSNVCNTLIWSPIPSRNSFAATDFALIDGLACGATERCPDFSASAPPLQFGFRRFAWGAPGDVIGHGLDNWKVTVWQR